MDEFIQKLEKIELPNQLVASIHDPLLQKLLYLRSSETTLQRIDYWLLAFFEDQLENGRSSETQIADMLELILQYTRFTKVGRITRYCFALLTHVRNCLRHAFRIWNLCCLVGTVSQTVIQF